MRCVYKVPIARGTLLKIYFHRFQLDGGPKCSWVFTFQLTKVAFVSLQVRLNNIFGMDNFSSPDSSLNSIWQK